MTRHWVSCRKFTVQVNTAGGQIVWAAPIVRKFLNGPLDKLLGWARSLGGLEHELL